VDRHRSTGGPGQYIAIKGACWKSRPRKITVMMAYDGPARRGNGNPSRVGADGEASIISRDKEDESLLWGGGGRAKLSGRSA